MPQTAVPSQIQRGGGVAHPGIRVGFVHILDVHVAEPIREVVVLRAFNSVGQVAEIQFFDAREKFFLLLLAEQAEDQLGCIGCAARYDGTQDEAGQITMVDVLGGFVAAKDTVVTHAFLFVRKKPTLFLDKMNAAQVLGMVLIDQNR